jgi:ribosome-binding protein aMBF1 (putative translation factor)
MPFAKGNKICVGREVSEETRAKMSAATKGKPRDTSHLQTPEVRAKRAASQAGEPGRSAMWGKARKVGDWETDWHFREIGRLIREARKERDIPIDELSEATGIGKTTISRIENAKSRRARNLGPTANAIIRIALALGVRPYELMP